MVLTGKKSKNIVYSIFLAPEVFTIAIAIQGGSFERGFVPGQSVDL